MIKYLLALTVLFPLGFPTPVRRDAAPPCQACHPIDPDKINVHLIPHSHDDVGWLKTADQYYYGNQNSIHKAGVQYIISSTVEALKTDPDRRFVQVETAFFWKWWQHQPDHIRQDFISLVNNGQLEIINGAWSMNDEAATNYQSIIDQFTYGLSTINGTIGQCGMPRIGWQIDAFGHSREQASIFAQMGYDAVFFARIDHDDRERRIGDKSMEVLWRGSANLDEANIFTSVFPEFYDAPKGFCFDIRCPDEVLNDDPTSPDCNVPMMVDVFEKKVTELADYYQTSNVLVPMGGDFHYQSAVKNFINMDKLIALQDRRNINLIYSTPSCYIKAVNEEASARNVEFAVKTDDFFPYGSDSRSYWTGYFTSRPNLKRFERQTNNILQSGKQLASFSKVNGIDHTEDLILLKQAVGVLQHHNAITGTAKSAVTKDYARLLTKSIKRTEPALGEILTNLLKKKNSSEINLRLRNCLLTNVSICDATDNDRFVVTVYNPLERPVTYHVRLPVNEGTYTVTGPDGEVPNDVLDSISSFNYINRNFGITKPKELLFAAEDLPSFGLRLYYVEKTASESKVAKLSPKSSFGTKTTNFEIDDETGLLKSVTMNGRTVEITQEFSYYTSFFSSSSEDKYKCSNVYIFRPVENESLTITDSVGITSIKGRLVDEVRQKVNNWITQVIRVYKGTNSNYIEFDWLVGPVDIFQGWGTEVISKFTIKNFDNSESFYTDSNGRELIKRGLSKRYDYEYNSTLEPVSSNYYPVTSRILIRDENQNLEVAVLNDRAQGGSSLSNGALELMVHRKVLVDDAIGIYEKLDDFEFGQGVVIRGQHYLLLGSINSDNDDAKSIAAQERELALEKLLTPLVLVGDASSADLSLESVQLSLNFHFEGLKKTLPDNVHILTLEPWTKDSYLLRLEHILEKDEDPNLSQSVTVDLTGLFSFFEITEIRETTLGANEWLDVFKAKEKYVWNIKNFGSDSQEKSEQTLEDGDLQVTLNPMQIRTFIIKVSKSV